MPFLGQRRTAPEADAARALSAHASAIPSHFRRWWPLVWAVLHLSGAAAGGALPGAPPARLASAPQGWGRLILLTPLLAWGQGSAGVVAAATSTVGAAAVWGWCEATSRRARADAVAADPWSPAQAVRGDGAGLLRITGWPTPAANDRWRGAARLVEFLPNTEGTLRISAGDGLLVTGSGPMPAIGEVIACRLAPARPRGAGISGAFDYREFLAGRGLAWTARADEIVPAPSAPETDLVRMLGVRILAPLRQSLVRGLDRVLPPRESALGASVLLGARDADSRRLSQPFADLGLAHLFAVSGLHVGIILGMVLLPARTLGLGPSAAALAVICLLPPYAVLTGLPGSVVRAAGLGALAAAAPCLGRRLDPLRALGCLYAASVGWDPAAALDTGLRLSYLAAGGILAVSRATGGLRFFARRPGSWLGTGLGVTLAAQWFTLPVAAQAFGRISLWAPMANLVAVPVFGAAVWFMVLALAASPVWLTAGQACGAVAWLLFRLLAAAVAVSARRAGAGDLGLPEPTAWQLAVWGGLTFGLLAALALLRRSGRPRAALLLLAASAPAGLALMVLPAWTMGHGRDVALHQFDVGQGDCGLLVFPDGWTALLDTGGVYGARNAGDGPFGREVLPWLRRAGRRRVDLCVLTHGHRDHTGGARAAAAGLRIDQWVCGGEAARALAGLPDTARIIPAQTPRTLHRWREWELILLAAPEPPGVRLDENDRSLVLVLRQAGIGRLVWGGDLETPGENRLLSAEPGLGRAQVWKAGHHGSDTSGGPAWLARLQPELVLISCGVGNRYRHPSHGPYVVGGDTLAVRRSDLHGSITLRWNARTGRLRARTVWEPLFRSPGALP